MRYLKMGGFGVSFCAVLMQVPSNAQKFCETDFFTALGTSGSSMTPPRMKPLAIAAIPNATFAGLMSFTVCMIEVNMP